MPITNKYSHEIEKILEFKELYLDYCELDHKRRPTQEDEEQKFIIREKLNTLNGEVRRYVVKSGISASVYYSPPPAVGGMAGDIEFFSNLFNLSRFSISPQMVIDALDRSVGNYLYFQREFNKKLFNPLYWVGEIIRLPFHLFKFAGFNSKKIELSWFGKLYKFGSSLLILTATILTILSLSGVNTKLFNLTDKTNNIENTQDTKISQPKEGLGKDPKKPQEKEPQITQQKEKKP